MSNEYMAQLVYGEAINHDGRYLLSRAQWRNKGSKWQACKILVDRGEARWLSQWSEKFPGIELTWGRP